MRGFRFIGMGGNPDEAAAAPPIPSTLLTGLISYWNFNETSGTRFDQLGVNDLINVSGAGFTAGIQGNAVTLPNHAYVSVPNNASLSPSGSFTFAGWVQMQAITGFQPWIITTMATSGNSRGIYLTVRTGPFELQVSSDGSTPEFAVATTFGNPITNTWYFVHCGFDQANGRAFISVNGGTVDTVAFVGPLHATTQPLYFGAVGGIGSDPIYVDEWGYWSRTLTPTEIAELYNAGSGTTYPFTGMMAGRPNFLTPPVEEVVIPPQEIPVIEDVPVTVIINTRKSFFARHKTEIIAGSVAALAGAAAAAHFIFGLI